MRREILRAKSAEKKPNITKSMPEVWGPKVITTKDAVVIAHRIGSHYVVSIMKRPTGSAEILFLFDIHSRIFFSLLHNIFTQGQGGKPHAQGRDNKSSG
jgi:hypothetical protein